MATRTRTHTHTRTETHEERFLRLLYDAQEAGERAKVYQGSRDNSEALTQLEYAIFRAERDLKAKESQPPADETPINADPKKLPQWAQRENVYLLAPSREQFEHYADRLINLSYAAQVRHLRHRYQIASFKKGLTGVVVYGAPGWTDHMREGSVVRNALNAHQIPILPLPSEVLA